MRLALWAIERAKITLSANKETIISLSETEIRASDSIGKELYLDITFDREAFNKIIAKQIAQTIQTGHEMIAKANLMPTDFTKIVFIGGPTNYKPLRDQVSFELGIPATTDVNPMTAVAEGASLFAESIDWSKKNHARKSTHGQIASNETLALSFNYVARTPDTKAKIAVQMNTSYHDGYEFQIDSIDTGWTSGRRPLKNGEIIDVNLTQKGDNTFKIFACDNHGKRIILKQDTIIITRTAATVYAIPASHSIGIEAMSKMGGPVKLHYLVRVGDSLPKKGKMLYKAAESLKAGSSGSLNFKLWEGEIEDKISDNRPIGVLKISGSDFDEGIIPVGAELECEYEVLDSGNILLEVSVPCIGSTFRSGKNFYSRQEGQIDYSSAATIVIEEGQQTLERLNAIENVVDNPKIEQAREKLQTAINLNPQETETETSQVAMENVLEAKKLIAQVRKENLKDIRQVDLDHLLDLFDNIKEYARASEVNSFDNLIKTAQRAIDRNDSDFEQYLEEMHGKIFSILWRQDWFVIEHFKNMIASPYRFADKQRFNNLVQRGNQLIQSNEIQKLREIIAALVEIRIDASSTSDLSDIANIIAG